MEVEHASIICDKYRTLMCSTPPGSHWHCYCEQPLPCGEKTMLLAHNLNAVPPSLWGTHHFGRMEHLLLPLRGASGLVTAVQHSSMGIRTAPPLCKHTANLLRISCTFESPRVLLNRGCGWRCVHVQQVQLRLFCVILRPICTRDGQSR